SSKSAKTTNVRRIWQQSIDDGSATASLPPSLASEFGASDGGQASPRRGTGFVLRPSMAENDVPTVEMSLEVLSDTIGKAAEDLRAVRVSLDQARLDLASRNTSVPRAVVKDAERAIDHLRQTDECLNAVLKELAQRD